MTRVRSAFTLVEAVATTVVLSVIAAITLPVINASTDSYAAAATASRVVDETCYAMDRIVRLLREAPLGPTVATLDIASMTSDSVRFADGRGIELSGDTLLVRFEDGATAPICRGVQEFELRSIRSDGTDAGADPMEAQRFEVRLKAGGLEVRSVAFARARYGT
ncbi:MAG: hypothetical protein KF757_12280 [Phycisphaeraceae bacterium]|nr:hypothetical protein [Phycisphaeraceae bacterium]MCW5762468.1 hypothetical protein [Phycisphaeraceae bacterium]